MKHILGSEMPSKAQREALSSFVHRYTRDHKPQWANQPWKDGLPYPVQFDSDQDWLAHTFFWLTEDGRLAEQRHCHSNPTWPDNPELRNQAAKE